MTQGALDLLARATPSLAGLRDRVLLLRSVENLDALDENALTILAEHATVRAYRKGELVTPEGETPQTVAIVMHGQVTVTRAGRPALVVTRGHGFGMFALMAEALTSRSVADVDSQILEIPAAAFRIALEENFSLLRGTLALIGSSLAEMRGNLPANEQGPVDVGVWFDVPLTLVEKLIRLRRGLFKQMNIDALVDLTRVMHELRIPAGHVFWTVGEPSTWSLHVEYGRVRCTAANGEHMDVGHEFTLGVMDVWSTQPRVYSARAVTPVIAYRIDYEDFLVILEMHGQVGRDILRGMARHYLDATGPRPSSPPLRPIMG